MLTLEEINPYLPYKLAMQYAHTGKVGFVSNIYTIGKGYDDQDLKLSIDFSEGEHIWMYKPLLFPLSYLEQEITVNGKVFIGRDEFSDYEYDLYSLEGYPLSKVLKHESFMELVKRKFDVFNLIPQGKAINVLEIDKNIYR